MLSRLLQFVRFSLNIWNANTTIFLPWGGIFSFFGCGLSLSSVSQSCLTYWFPMNHIMPGLSIHLQLPESTQSHVHSDAIQPSCPCWCHPTILSSWVYFSSCLQSFPASRSFHMSQLFTSGAQSIGVSASTSVLPMNTQDWSLGWTGGISLQSKGLSRVFSNTTVQKHQFFITQLSL